MSRLGKVLISLLESRKNKFLEGTEEQKIVSPEKGLIDFSPIWLTIILVPRNAHHP